MALSFDVYRNLMENMKNKKNPAIRDRITHVQDVGSVKK